MEIKYLADSMLGKLAKWLRVMGYDTHYQAFYREGVFEELFFEGRKLLSRNRAITERYKDSIYISSGHVKDQLSELMEERGLPFGRAKWFSRCLICNVTLTEARIEDARENIPEYVYYHNITQIHSCPSCHRYFWPGSHRERMIIQLQEWGF